MKAQSDVQSEISIHFDQLDWVGMSQIQSALLVDSADLKELTLPMQLDLGVNLLENNRGIHMSRLYKLHQDHLLNQKLSSENLSVFARECLSSQAGISQKLSLKMKMIWPKKTQSLKSELTGYRNYNIQIIFEKDLVQEGLWLQYEILYSSTCPQSAGLALEVLKNISSTDLIQHIERLPATPHAQRSRAVVQIKLNEINQKIINRLIDETESALGTPVQTTVKKADEMEFAILNAKNLMFCEDAARKISDQLKSNSLQSGYSIFCEHQESLHPHNASSLKKVNYIKPLSLEFN